MGDIDMSALHKHLTQEMTAGVSEDQKNKLEKRMMPALTELLCQLATEQPEDPHTWLAQHVTDRNIKAEWVETAVMKMTPGEFFGEIALLSNKPRQATVRATTKVSLLVVTRDAFNRLCGSLFDVLKRNMSTYATMQNLPEEMSTEVTEEDELEFVIKPEDNPMPPQARNRQRRSCVFVEAVALDADWVPPVYDKSDDEKSRIEIYSRSTRLLSALEDGPRANVVGAFQKMEYKAGEDIIVEGDPIAEYFYILDAGEATAIKKIEGAEKEVFSYQAGGSFGELALLHGEPRAATVRAKSECKIWALDRDTFRRIMMSAGKQSMDSRVKFLNKSKLFDELQQYEKFRIAESMTLRHYEKGDEILKEGDAGNEFYIVETGVCHAYKRSLKF